MVPSRPGMTKRILLITSVLVLVLTVPTLAGSSWTRVQSPHFTVISNTSEDQARRVALKLEQFRAAFVRLFAVARFDTPVPTRVVVLKGEEEFDTLRPLRGAQTVRGFLLHNPDVDYMVVTIQGMEAPASVIYHEYVHALTRNNTRRAPLWFVEGIADYYSTLETDNDLRKVIIGKPLRNYVHYLRGRDLIPLRSLFAIDKSSPYYADAEKSELFYAQSWALIHCLMQGKRHGLERYLKLLSNGVGYSESLTEAFNADLNGLEGELRAYIKRERYSFDEITPENPLTIQTETRLAPLAEAETKFYLGDLLLHQNRIDEAAPMLEQAVALDGKLSYARASLGMLRTKQKRFDEAREELARATSTETRDPLAHYYYAYALSRELMPAENNMTKPSPETARLMRAQLRQAVELAPQFAEAQRLLAVLEFVVGEDIDEAERAIRRALTVSPDEGEYIYLLAQILMREMRLIEARALLKTLITTPAEEVVRARAVDLIDKVELEIATNPAAKPPPPNPSSNPGIE
jgi:tetratricopeptide (TPR) repeat protein